MCVTVIKISFFSDTSLRLMEALGDPTTRDEDENGNKQIKNNVVRR